jgi:adenylate kinase
VQSYILDGLLKKHGSSIAKIIELEVPILELIQRLVKRSQTDECMPYDSSIEKIVQRLKDHEKQNDSRNKKISGTTWCCKN